MTLLAQPSEEDRGADRAHTDHERSRPDITGSDDEKPTATKQCIRRRSWCALTYIRDECGRLKAGWFAELEAATLCPKETRGSQSLVFRLGNKAVSADVMLKDGDTRCSLYSRESQEGVTGSINDNLRLVDTIAWR